jgi:hypothetical protein
MIRKDDEERTRVKKRGRKLLTSASQNVMRHEGMVRSLEEKPEERPVRASIVLAADPPVAVRAPIEILQIRRRNGQCLYLVERGERIWWASKGELLRSHPEELADFYEGRILTQYMRNSPARAPSIPDGQPLYIKIE